MKISSYQGETYIYFILQSHDLIKKNSYCGLIVPNTWMVNIFGKDIRRHILEEFTLIAVQHYIGNVFADAKVDSQTLITKKASQKGHKIAVEILSKNDKTEYQIEQDYWKKYSETSINIYQSSPEIRKLSQKLQNKDNLLKLFKVTQGTKPFQKGKGTPKQTAETLKTKPFVSETKNDDSFVPLLRGSLMNRYKNLWNNNYWISFGDWLAEPRYSASYDAPEKIVIRQTGYVLVATLDERQFIVRDNLYTIVPKDNSCPLSLATLCGLINSRLFKWYYQNVLSSEVGEGLAQVKRTHINALPLPVNYCELGNNDVHSLVHEILHKNEIFLKINNKFLALLKSEFNLEKIGRKLENWFELEFSELSKEVEKLIKPKKLLLSQKSEWIEYFEKEKYKALKLKNEIDQTDREIDQMVYDLYELTPKEIDLIESSA